MIINHIIINYYYDTDRYRYIQNTDTDTFSKTSTKIYFQYLNETPYDLVAAQ